MRNRRAGAVGPALALPAWGWLLVFFVAPVAMVVWFSFGYKPGVFGTHANDILSLDRYAEAISPTFFTTFTNTLWVLGTAGLVKVAGLGGHGECLRRSRGDVAGA